jgi:hypothetical protein
MTDGKTEAAPAAGHSPSDRFTPWYLPLVMFVFLLFWCGNELDRIFNLYLFILPVLFIPCLIVTVALFVGGLRAGLRRHWRRLASVVAAPPLAWAFFASLNHTGISPEWLRFQLAKGPYLEQITRSERGSDGLRFKVFNWGSAGGVGVGERFYTLVYDESDGIALPADERTTTWKQRVGPGTGSQLYSILQPEDEHHSTKVKLVEGHFYLVTEVYQ